jgi:hypothetical protein
LKRFITSTSPNVLLTKVFVSLQSGQGSLTEGEGSVQLTSSLR